MRHSGGGIGHQSQGGQWKLNHGSSLSESAIEIDSDQNQGHKDIEPELIGTPNDESGEQDVEEDLDLQLKKLQELAAQVVSCSAGMDDEDMLSDNETSENESSSDDNELFDSSEDEDSDDDDNDDNLGPDDGEDEDGECDSGFAKL